MQQLGPLHLEQALELSSWTKQAKLLVKQQSALCEYLPIVVTLPHRFGPENASAGYC